MNELWDPDWDPYDLLIFLTEQNQNKDKQIEQLQRAAHQQAFLINVLTKQNAKLNEAMAQTLNSQAQQITRTTHLERQVKELHAIISATANNS